MTQYIKTDAGMQPGAPADGPFGCHRIYPDRFLASRQEPLPPTSVAAA